MKKRTLILATLVILAVTMIVSAAEPRAGGIPVLAFRGTTADCSAVCMGDYATDRVNVTLTLKHGASTLGTWSGSGVGRASASGSCTVERGEEYTLTLTWSINGVQQPSSSTTQECP